MAAYDIDYDQSIKMNAHDFLQSAGFLSCSQVYILNVQHSCISFLKFVFGMANG